VKQLVYLIILFSFYNRCDGQLLKPSTKFFPATTISTKGFWLEKNPDNIKHTPSNVICDGRGWNHLNLRSSPPSFIKPVRIADYVSTLGIICRQELKFDKITPLPVRFRLGSLDYVNWMERKPNAIKPQ
jgi:hypothetical protein